MNDKNLFSEFPQASKAQWKERAAKELKGTAIETSLAWDSPEGFKIEPYYAPEDLEGLAYLQKNHNALADSDGLSGSPRPWANMPWIACGQGDEKAANAAALHALNNGADGLYFQIETATVDLAALLAGIQTEYCRLSFRFVAETLAKALDRLENAFAVLGQPMTALSGSVSAGKAEGRTDAAQAGNAKAPSFKTMALRVFADTAGDEIAALLAQAVQWLYTADDKKAAADALCFETMTGNDFFMEIAKIKALRFLFAEIAQRCGLVDYKPSDVYIHAFTTDSLKKGETDAYKNMLSNATQASAAVFGGCNALTVMPHDMAMADAGGVFSSRIALNVSNILKEEAYLDKVADPAAGSYFIENLTDRLAEAAWKKFQALC